jgi:four helix bundle protein
MRDHTKLVAFEAADALVLAVYRATRAFPSHERFGLTAQLRRAAVSVATNIVEGCGRETAADYGRFLMIAFASCREAQYEIDLAIRLEYVEGEAAKLLMDTAVRAGQLLNRLIASVRAFKEE